MIKIYSKQNCQNCVKAKSLLKNYKIDFEEIAVDKDVSAQEFLVSKGLRGVPQVFDGESLVGGYEQLFKYLLAK